ncbi:glycoside hydrolase [Actinopolymorpha sp. NPDC004070]|uniref:RICIN domain-containing protein n=1 Tax=Actinopolymorpha sp. NPDC004070 TaxID=3154548 RepID=UPI0033BBC590
MATPSATIQPDPSYQHPAFEGWGTSLVWFANATGDYPDQLRETLVRLVFGEDGLRLNIARYNIGGGNAPDVRDYLRSGGAVPGWWQAREGTTRRDVGWWSADDPADWNADADRTQRWWVDRIRPYVTRWETFSNSPPWFMTRSGYVSGGFLPWTDQLKSTSVRDFARYVVGVTERLEAAHGIRVDSIDPFNEPNTNHWVTVLGFGRRPVGGRQEGAHIGPELQQRVVRALAEALEDSATDARIAAMDETNPSLFVRNWTSYPADVKAAVGRLNVHTYATARRTAVRDLAKSDGKPLWMSEVEGDWGHGQDFEDIEPGLGLAQHITDDLRELEPSAWVFWQPIEDYDNMTPGGQGDLGGNWGEIQVPFDCTARDTPETCPVRTNQKFNTARNFTHHIRPGDHLVKVDDANTVAAIRPGARTVTLVHTNPTPDPRDLRVDLSKFDHVGPGGAVTAIVTDRSGALREHPPVPVDGAEASIRVPPRSVTTMVVTDVAGIAEDAATFRDGHTYRFVGVQSGRSLAADPSEPSGRNALVVRTTDAANAGQLWTVARLTGGWTNREHHHLRAHDGRQVAVRSGALVLEPAQASPDEAARWYLSTTGDGTYTMANVAGPGNLEVTGQATADGSVVGVWQPNAGPNQRWRVIDETVPDG